MRLAIARSERPVVVAVCGEIDVATAPRLRARLVELVHQDAPGLVADLSGVTFCDSSGLAAFLDVAHRAELLGGRLVVAAPRPQLRKLLELSGVEHALATYGTVAEALTVID